MESPEVSTIVLVGTDQVEPESVRLSAGPLSAEFQGGGLRYVRYGEHEVIRAIAFLARDENWGTHALELADVDIRHTADSFEVRFKGKCGPTGGELRLSAVIAGHADGRLSFTADASLDGDLLTNRLLTYNALRMKFREVPLKRKSACPVCGDNPSITEAKDELDALTVCDLKGTP